jgi:hypothetical protein
MGEMGGMARVDNDLFICGKQKIGVAVVGAGRSP